MSYKYSFHGVRGLRQSNTEKWMMMALPCFTIPCTFVIVFMGLWWARIDPSEMSNVSLKQCWSYLICFVCLSDCNGSMQPILAETMWRRMEEQLYIVGRLLTRSSFCKNKHLPISSFKIHICLVFLKKVLILMKVQKCFWWKCTDMETKILSERKLISIFPKLWNYFLTSSETHTLPFSFQS